jgi:anti-sigma regulatory factor (Ser/Thr protein kinase)
MDRFELTLRNRLPEIARSQDELEKFAAGRCFPERPLHELQLALEEHLTNIIRYAYDDQAEHQIQVRFEFNPPELRLEVEDDGRPFNPLEHPAPDLTLPLDERPIGGLGIHMIRKSLDQVTYRRGQDRNVLVMSKRA